MAHESFEDVGIAEILNQYFVSIKVDKEERPDIDSVYMSVCQALTGSGGWPTTIFLTPDQKPFYAGTYFPKTAKYGRIGLEQLLLSIHQMWISERTTLLESAEEIKDVLGENEGENFNKHFNITEQGNFEGKNIPNLLRNSLITEWDAQQLEKLYQYRKNRYSLHLDDKILTSWNGLMIAALCYLYRVSGEMCYLNAAKESQAFIEKYLCENDILYVSYREGVRNKEGFLDDYANEIFALLALYEATLEQRYLERASIRWAMLCFCMPYRTIWICRIKLQL